MTVLQPAMPGSKHLLYPSSNSEIIALLKMQKHPEGGPWRVVFLSCFDVLPFSLSYHVMVLLPSEASAADFL